MLDNILQNFVEKQNVGQYFTKFRRKTVMAIIQHLRSIEINLQ